MPHQPETTWKYFEENPLTHSAAHYLMTIKALLTEQGYARMTDIAEKLKITAGSCSLSLKALKRRGLIVEDKNKFLRLSEIGQELVLVVEKNDQVLEKFFREVLGVESWQAEIDACKIEHLISMETSIRLCAFLHFLEKAPKSIQVALKKFAAKKTHCAESNENCPLCAGSCAPKRKRK